MHGQRLRFPQPVRAVRFGHRVRGVWEKQGEPACNRRVAGEVCPATLPRGFLCLWNGLDGVLPA